MAEPAAHPITVAIERRIDPARTAEATSWMQAGTDLAARFPGFLGSGWVRAGETSDLWYMLYRFRDIPTLEDWEESAQREWWLSSGRAFASEVRVERRTGVEGWFDAPFATGSTRPQAPLDEPATSAEAVAGAGGERAETLGKSDPGTAAVDGTGAVSHTGPVQQPIPSAPPRWKQAVTIWLGFFPTNLLATWLLGFVPGFADWPLITRVLLATVLLTPVMTYAVLPWATRLLRPWLHRAA